MRSKRIKRPNVVRISLTDGELAVLRTAFAVVGIDEAQFKRNKYWGESSRMQCRMFVRQALLAVALRTVQTGYRIMPMAVQWIGARSGEDNELLHRIEQSSRGIHVLSYAHKTVRVRFDGEAL